jgi:hypothetical protein
MGCVLPECHLWAGILLVYPEGVRPITFVLKALRLVLMFDCCTDDGHIVLNALGFREYSRCR